MLFDKLSEFIGHLKMHIKDGVKVACPFSGCKRQFTNISYFSAHKCRCHKDWTSNHISVDNYHDDEVDNSLTNETVDGGMCGIEQSHSEEHNHSHFTDDHSQIETKFDDHEESTDNLQDIFINSLALFYLKLQVRYILPASTIQMIIEEFQTVHDQGQKVHHAKRLGKLCDLGVEMDNVKIKEVVKELFESYVLHFVNSNQLKTDLRRKSFFKTKFNYVQPYELYLTRIAI